MDLDLLIRLAAFDFLNRLRDATGPIVLLPDLENGFEFRGEHIPLINRQRGIWRPRQLADDWPALSVTTAPPRPGKTPPYDDQVGANTGWFAYIYEKDDPNTWTNRAVRRAYELQRPLIYFYGHEPGQYHPIYPMWVQADDPANLTFHLAADVPGVQPLESTADAAALAVRRAYATVEVKKRLHQDRFSYLVVKAYQTRCAVCRIGHKELLDAAHILPDRDERGRPEVPNGLALCKIHHAAFDAHILGIAPDSIIHIRHDILEERDGPMLQYGLQKMNKKSIDVPKNPLLKPNKEYLAERFDRFRAA